MKTNKDPKLRTFFYLNAFWIDAPLKPSEVSGKDFRKAISICSFSQDIYRVYTG